MEKVARRVDDADIMHLLKIMLKASGRKGVPQGGVISPLLSNLYLNEVDKMLERARKSPAMASTPTSNTRVSRTIVRHDGAEEV
ncbi:retron-type reverse transcriptase [Bradyrhizobium sp. USDA 4503]